MMFLDKASTGLWIMDMQERLFPQICRSKELLGKICFMIDAALMLKLPIVITEQNPKGLGRTIKDICDRLPMYQTFYEKTTFSGYRDKKVQQALHESGIQTWILAGIEAHICVLQTAKDLICGNMQPIVPCDCIGARASESVSVALDELKACKVRTTSAETIIYELIKDANSEDFKDILPIIKANA